MARKISCFVSFSSIDGNERDIRFLVDTLDAELSNFVSFKAYYDQRSGFDLKRFMETEVQECEAALVLLTPDYKRKVDQGISSGVHTEFLHIVDRIEHPGGKEFLCIPIFWRGSSYAESIPEYFSNREFARDLHRFQAFGTGGRAPYLPDRVRQSLKSDLDRIVSDLETLWADLDPSIAPIKQGVDSILLSTPDFAEEPDIEGAMFTKSERSPLAIEEFSEKLFVKTSAYRSVNKYHKTAFTGRKGSGKTTLLKMYKYLNSSRYLPAIDIEVNDWSLHDLLGDLTFKTSEGDLSYTAPESKIFDYVWPVFLGFCVVKSINEASLTSEYELIVNSDIRDRFESANNRYDRIFHLSVEAVRWFLQDCIDRASTRDEASFKSDLLNLINVQACTESLFGYGYEGIVNALASDRLNRRILFCLDRFDTEIQKYRKDLKDRRLSDDQRWAWECREVYWIQGLVEMIDHLRSPDYYSLNQEFYKVLGPHIDFCVPLPRDRLVEVQQRRRDSIVANINEEINWKPYELLTLLRKRLQVVWDIDESILDKKKFIGARERFNRIMEIANRRLPSTVNVEIAGRSYEFDTFLNVLRHSFFRPRDVLIYYARLIVSLEAARKRKKTLSSVAVSGLVSEQTYRIVEEEFVGEFCDTIKNLREVLKLFHSSPQVYGWDELKEKLDRAHIDLYGGETILHLGQKASLLYDIGFIGVCSAGGQIGGFPLNDYVFSFTNPRLSWDWDDLELLSKLRFAIHPVFIEYLRLELGSHPPVLMLDWGSLEALDTFE